MGPEMGIVMLVLRGSKKGYYGATAAPAKGTHHAAISYGTGLVRSLGHRRMVLQSDGEPSIVVLKKGDQQGSRRRGGNDSPGIATIWQCAICSLSRP